MRRFVTLLVISTILVFSILANTPDAFGKGRSSPSVTSKQYGYDLQQSREGIPLVVSKMFLNTMDVAQNITVVFDIRKDNVTMYLGWQEDVAIPSKITSASVSWTPQIAGEYQIRTLVISNMTKPEVLENVSVSSFNIMSDEDFMASYSDRTTSLAIVSVQPVPMSPSTPIVAFNEKQYLGNGSNAFIHDISASDNGLYIIGISELPSLRENPPDDVANELVFFAASNDGGLKFEPMRYLVNNTRDLTFVGHPLVHPVNDTLVYATWLQQAYHRDELNVVLSKSLDGGRYFGNAVNLAHGGVVFGDLDMAVSKDGKSLYIVRTMAYDYSEPLRSTLVFTKSTDYGLTFTPDQVILHFTGSSISCAQIAIKEGGGNSTDDNVYLSWRESSGDLLFTASFDNGVTFIPPVIVREAYSGDSDCATLAVYGNDVYLAWTGTRLVYRPEDPAEILVPDTDVFFIASRDNGRSFESPVNLSEGIGAFTMESEILVSDGRIYAVWRDTIPEVGEDGFLSFYGNSEVILTRSLVCGRTFERPVNLS
ncbi:MAG: hypothetical protein ACRD5H_04245, partial [Nitrososphaerales archaeon]